MPNAQNEPLQPAVVHRPPQPTKAQRVAFAVSDAIRAGSSTAVWVIVGLFALGAVTAAVISVLWGLRRVLQAFGK